MYHIHTISTAPYYNSKINSYSAYLETLTFFPWNQHQNFKIKNIPWVSWGGSGHGVPSVCLMEALPCDGDGVGGVLDYFRVER